MENPRILLMDNHMSHLLIEALDAAKGSGVIILTLHFSEHAGFRTVDILIVQKL